MSRIEQMNNSGSKNMIRTWSRASTIFPEMVGHTIACPRRPQARPGLHLQMVGHKLGEEFAPTRTAPQTARWRSSASDGPREDPRPSRSAPRCARPREYLRVAPRKARSSWSTSAAVPSRKLAPCSRSPRVPLRARSRRSSRRQSPTRRRTGLIGDDLIVSAAYVDEGPVIKR